MIAVFVEGEFFEDALAGEVGCLVVEGDIAGLAADDVELKPGTFLGVGRKLCAGNVQACFLVAHDEDGIVTFEAVNHCFHGFTWQSLLYIQTGWR